ncbi:cobyrinic acid a,c-diamide synthase [Ectothiorhodospira marina]|nr:cobyrinic acid a,c-diamide synthase [Ectothiorhodospira marina]
MMGFLQGFAYGLFLSCLPWLIIGMIEPRLAVPVDPPTRWQVLLRYWLIIPFIAFILWATSLFGGFGPTLGGWVAGLLAIFVAIPAERGLRGWLRRRAERRREAEREAAAARERAALERKAREAGLAILDPEQPPVGADELVRALCQTKGDLLKARRPDLASQVDRIYTRYTHVNEVLEGKFDARELTFERSLNLVREVSWTAVDNLNTMASVARGVRGVDVENVRGRLSRQAQMTDEERQALERRLELVEETETRLRELGARNEAAITALDDAAVAVSAVSTDRPRASVAANQALEDLRQFVEKAHHYGRQGE